MSRVEVAGGIGMAGGGTGVAKVIKGDLQIRIIPIARARDRSRAMIQSDAKQIARSNLAYISLEQDKYIDLCA